MTSEIETKARELCEEAGLDPDERSPGPRSIVGIPEDAWPNWEYFYEDAEDRIIADGAKDGGA